MNLIDTRTVVLITGVMGGLMALVLLSLKRNFPPSIKGLGEWSASLAILFVAGVQAAARGVLPDFLSIGAANILITLGIYLSYLGSQRFFGVRPRMGPWLVFLLLWQIAGLWWLLVEPSYVYRLRLATVGMAVLFFSHAWLVRAQRPHTFAKLTAFGVLTGIGLVQLLRFASTFLVPVGANNLDGSLEQVAFVTAFAISILLISISMVLMANDQLRAELEQLATRDSLTNALTRRYINESCHQELVRCQRNGRSMALLIMDLDQFKAINDTYGHQAGDRVLINFVTRVNALLRAPDQLGRFGGEEFVVLLPDTALPEAMLVAERIRALCAQGTALAPGTPAANTHPTHDTHGPHGTQPLGCTVSIGVATNQGANDSVDSLVARADAAMYRAKAQGRNRVEAASTA